jgi:hypothetical protein
MGDAVAVPPIDCIAGRRRISVKDAILLPPPSNMKNGRVVVTLSCDSRKVLSNVFKTAFGGRLGVPYSDDTGQETTTEAQSSTTTS